ncbi:hypothetical protein M378DRAFT_406580 [Amanita muscaria Koide BX008]|uniref:Uncharacterized protein n=1 Tax=Amanita muscaria (strain Koide BX008) TaxID=946122 RepID=A0A0C2TH20_AMAMK|nr:hypothetical protein M378DRAFT_406580 [Amanita muscaria Koide BX008]
MHRAIVFKHQEVHIKGDIKAWGRVQKKEISSETIHSCLEMMGFDNLSKNTLFEQLLPCQSNPEADEGENDDFMSMHASLGIFLGREASGCCLPTSLLGLDDASTEEHRDDPLSDTDEGFETVMKEERELDTQDKKRQKRYEATLWKDVT